MSEPCMCGASDCPRCFPEGEFYEDEDGNVCDPDGNIVCTAADYPEWLAKAEEEAMAEWSILKDDQ